MSKQLPLEERKPVVIAGFRQNCYRIGTSGGVVAVAQTPNRTIKTYTSLEKKTLPNGYVEEIIEKDYPISSESVTSFADGADYRNDPAQAIASAPNRVNLGDVTQAQAFLENPQSYARMFKDVAAQLDKYIAAKNATPNKTVEQGEEK